MFIILSRPSSNAVRTDASTCFRGECNTMSSFHPSLSRAWLAALVHMAQANRIGRRSWSIMRRDCGWSHPLEVKSFSLYVESVLLALQTRFDQSILASEAIRQCIPAQVSPLLSPCITVVKSMCQGWSVCGQIWSLPTRFSCAETGCLNTSATTLGQLMALPAPQCTPCALECYELLTTACLL